MLLLGGVLLLSGLLLVAGLVWAFRGRRPAAGALVALSGLFTPLFVLTVVSFGSNGGAGAVLVPWGIGLLWAVAGVTVGRTAPPTWVRPARPGSFARMPAWLVVRLVSVLVVVVVLIAGAVFAAEAFTLFPTKEPPERLDDMRRAAAMQALVVLVGLLAVAALWWFSLRRRAAGGLLAASAGVAASWSVVGLIAALPLVLTAVVLVLLPDEPGPTRRRVTSRG